jgi:Na+-transporting NADH:ubiquinone oxidoreductase subunit NqrC
MDPWHRWLFPPALVLSAGAAHAEQYLSVEEAQAAMFSGQQLSAQSIKLTADQARAIEEASGINVRVKDVRVWRAQDGGVFFVDQVLGKHEYITWALGVNADGSVRAIEILDYRETYGSEVRNQRWRAQFVGKRHGARLKLDRDIANISGATLSCRHVTDGVKRLLATYELVLKQ